MLICSLMKERHSATVAEMTFILGSLWEPVSTVIACGFVVCRAIVLCGQSGILALKKSIGLCGSF